jgi:6-phosphogluconate dehydrogenase
MKMAMIGLGRMGGNMVRRLTQGGHTCVVYDVDPKAVAQLAQEGALPASSLEQMLTQLDKPRVIWMMLPAGAVTQEMTDQLSALLEPQDILIDGGNSHFKDDVKRAKALAPKGVRYVDVGTSGGVWGLERGYSLMIGGDAGAAEHLAPIFKTLAPGVGSIKPSPGREAEGRTADQGYLYCGPAGAGHFVKMIHNGIEYGMMQALAEGFDILKGASRPEVDESYRYDLDLREISEVWRRGSVVSSWLLDLVALALNADPHLQGFEGHVADSGEGRWTVQAALEEAVPATVLSAALFARFRSREERSFADQLLSAMRRGFGGHPEGKVQKIAS